MAEEGTLPTSPSGTSQKVQFHSFIRSIQRIALYKTETRYFLVGSNNTETKFRLLKIDRTEPKELVIFDDKIVYSAKEIREILNMIDDGNRSKVGQKVGSGFSRTVSAFGVIGFVRFLEGYYILLITKRRRMAMLGHHCIYKIEDTALVPIPNDEVREPSSDEARYVKMFQAIDLSSNFYFSYGYDLTQTLQYNLEDPKFLMTKNSCKQISSIFPADATPAEVSYVGTPNVKYLWNSYLLKPIENRIHTDWILNVIHGFVDQSNISIYGTPVLMTLIARRSCRFAGTRFQKRGANFNGDVANEVETEQIVINSSVSSFSKCNATSFVQIRGSVPGHWTQDLSSMVPKPQIFFQLSDPYCRTAAKHFDGLLQKYGAPIIVLNLVKKRERRRKHESLLTEEYSKQLEYLNLFLPEESKIQSINFDMARCKKKVDIEVMSKLEEIAGFAVKKTGIFHNQPTYYKNKLRKKARVAEGIDRQESRGLNGSRQTGVVRTNCVDCLDRTNTAQFAVAKVALGLQLYALGFLSEPTIQYDCDCARMLEAMFEDHGDTLALQYGGSQLIHRIKSYRKESKWTSKANDITQTVRRYYSNALTDAEKQNTINLFLGVFSPHRSRPAIWDRELQSDTYLHLNQLVLPHAMKNLMNDIQTQWWNPRMKTSLPYPLVEKEKACSDIIKFDSANEAFDLYRDFYRPFEHTIMGELFTFKDVSHSVRDYMPHCCTDYSPFVVRQREGKRREDNNVRVKHSFRAFLNWGSNVGGNYATPGGKNPSVAGLASTASTTSNTTSDSDDLSSSTEELDFLLEPGEESRVSDNEYVSFESILTNNRDPYGVIFQPPSIEDEEQFRRFEDIYEEANHDLSAYDSQRKKSLRKLFPSVHIVHDQVLNLHDYSKKLLPEIRSEDLQIYQDYLHRGATTICHQSPSDLAIYQLYFQRSKCL